MGDLHSSWNHHFRETSSAMRQAVHNAWSGIMKEQWLHGLQRFAVLKKVPSTKTFELEVQVDYMQSNTISEIYHTHKASLVSSFWNAIHLRIPFEGWNANPMNFYFHLHLWISILYSQLSDFTNLVQLNFRNVHLLVCSFENYSDKKWLTYWKYDILWNSFHFQPFSVKY